MTITIMIADDHTILRETLRTHIEMEADLHIIAEASNAAEAVEKAQTQKPDIIIMDIHLPDPKGEENRTGIEATMEIKKNTPEIKIIALTQYCDKRYIRRMMEAGCSCFLSKNCGVKELVQAVREVHSEGSYISQNKDIRRMISEILSENKERRDDFTSREIEVLKLLAKGKIPKQIAPSFFLSEKSIELDRAKVLRKANVKNIPELVVFAIKEGYIFL
ncbi:MAG: response regulator transcription factor [Chitinivibrionales bacterium]|nr:response regulator transcription factor [Chitinivibrionales bacterium]